MRLESWWALALLLVVPLLHRWWMGRNRPARLTFSLPVPSALGKGNPLRWIFLLKYAALGLMILSLARPQASYRQTERTVSGVEIMMVMDVSASMNIEDLNERPRFDVAKETMEAFVKGRESDRIGLVVFSGEPLTIAPPTLDYGLVLSGIREATSGVLKDGTGIGDGLSLAVSHLRGSKARSRIIILLTDGDNNVGQVDPGTAGEMAAGYGIRVYTIAIGREGRVKLPIRHKGALGNTITTYQWFENALNPELLQQIAAITSGKFYRVTEGDALPRVFSEIDRLEKTEIKSAEKVRYEEAFQKPLKAGLAILLIEQLLSRGWWRLLP
jgi:Ca-activated chloride channel homolog